MFFDSDNILFRLIERPKSIIIGVFVLLAITAWNDWKKQSQQMVFLGLVTSLYSPCLIIDDYSYFFLKIGMLGNSLYIILTWMLYAFIKNNIASYAFTTKYLTSSRRSTLFQCFFAESNASFNSTKTCLENQDFEYQNKEAKTRTQTSEPNIELKFSIFEKVCRTGDGKEEKNNRVHYFNFYYITFRAVKRLIFNNSADLA